jgi:phosphate transport system substrate-binding protein
MIRDMKRYTIIGLLTLAIITAFGQSNTSGVVKLRGTRLTYPLVRKWIAAFNKLHPDVQVVIAQSAPADSIDLIFAAHSIVEGDLKAHQASVAVTRYAQLPIANSNHPGLKEMQGRGFRESDFNNLFFSTSSASTFGTLQSPITVYTRERPACAAVTFARHFGNDPKAINGVGVKGDDQDLAAAVRNDVNGVSFNNLGFIYDVGSRKITEGLVVIPLDLNENGSIEKDEEVYNTLDEAIAFIERTNHRKFVVENVNVIFNKAVPNTAVVTFLNWILTNGQSFNHEAGFLDLGETSLATQKVIIAGTFKTSVPSHVEIDALNQRKQTQGTKTASSKNE